MKHDWAQLGTALVATAPQSMLVQVGGVVVVAEELESEVVALVVAADDVVVVVDVARVVVVEVGRGQSGGGRRRGDGSLGGDLGGRVPLGHLQTHVLHLHIARGCPGARVVVRGGG